MRGLLIAGAALVAAAFAGAGSPASPAPFPAYVTPTGWSLVSDSSWRANGAPARSLAPFNLGQSSPGETQSLVWAHACTSDAGTVDFVRTVDLPGEPAGSTFTFENPGVNGLAEGPLSSVRLLVNDRTVATIAPANLNRGSLQTISLDRAALAKFRYGSNRIDVEVTTPALPATMAHCNTSPANRVGIVFALQASTSADLSTSAGKAAVQTFRLSAGTSTWTVQGAFTLRNAGPSAATAGSFVLDLQPGFEKYDEGLADADGPFGTCVIDTKVTPHVKVICPFAVFPAGRSATVRVRLRFDVSALRAQPGGYDDIHALWAVNSGGNGVQGTNDPEPGNNGAGEDFVLCGPKGDPAHCAKAVSGRSTGP